MVLQLSKHKQPEGSEEMKISKPLLTVENSNYKMRSLPNSISNKTLDGLILLTVIPGYKADAKNTNNRTSFRYSCCF